MKYRVRTDLSFDKESDARDFMEDSKIKANKAVSVNEGNINEEISYCDIEKCYHDENPTKPCEKIERVEIRKKQGRLH